jgi:cyclic pyranopterin phosphate synthase
MGDLTHFDASGASRMVDVGQKPATHRIARASGRIHMQPATLQRILDRSVEKGNVLEVARLAGIMAAKRTDQWIPLCHQVPLTSVRLDLEKADAGVLAISATVETVARTGVEMEALVAVSAAALTVYDMCKAIDRQMVLGPIQLEFKQGGRSGTFQRSPATPSGPDSAQKDME